MVPELTTCEICGRTVIVLSWSPADESIRFPLVEAGELHDLEINCQIDCPACGTRIQTVVTAVPADRA